MSTATAPAPIAAAGKTRPKRSLRQTAVYYVLLTFGPLTDAQLVNRYDTLRRYIGQQYGSIAQSPSGLRTRRRELVNLGYVDAVGQTSGPGRKHTIWKAL